MNVRVSTLGEHRPFQAKCYFAIDSALQRLTDSPSLFEQATTL